MAGVFLKAQQNDLLSQARALLQVAQRNAAAWSAAFVGESGAKRRAGKFGILMYHRVTEPVKGMPKPTWNVTPKRLHQQLAGLQRRGYQAWPLRKVLEYQRQRLRLPEKVFVVTFDDGYENNFTQAFPVLRDLNIPATIFLATAYLGTNEPLPFDDWAAKGSPQVPADAWRAMNLEQCKALQASGLVELAAHTHTHQDFRGRLDELRDDLRMCVAFLRERLGIDQPTFAFPYGTKKLGFSGPAMSRVAREVGLLCSLTTEWELARLDSDPFDWGRFQVDQSDTAATIAGKLSGWYSVIRAQGKAVLRMLQSKQKQTEPVLANAPLRLGRFR